MVHHHLIYPLLLAPAWAQLCLCRAWPCTGCSPALCSPLSCHSHPACGAKGSVTHMGLPPMSNSVGLSRLSQLRQLGGRAAASLARHETGHSVPRTQVKTGDQDCKTWQRRAASHQMQEQYPVMAGGAGKEVHRHGLQGFLSNTVSSSFFLAQTCSFFSWEMHRESQKPVREDGRRWWEHKAVMYFSGWKEAQVIK